MLAVIWLIKQLLLDQRLTGSMWLTVVGATTIQVYFVWSLGRLGDPPNPFAIAGQMANSVGMYFTYGVFGPSLPISIALGALLLGVLFLTVIRLGILDAEFWPQLTAKTVTTASIASALVGALLLSALAGGVGTNPVDVGPRYFFFPFQILSVCLVLALQECKAVVIRAVLVLGILFSQVGTAKAWDRHHDSLNWQDQIVECALSTDEYFTVTVHYIGESSEAWTYDLRRSICT